MISLRTFRYFVLRAALIAAILLAGAAFSAPAVRADAAPLDHLRVTVNGPQSVTLDWDPLPEAAFYDPSFAVLNLGWDMWSWKSVPAGTTTFRFDGPPYMICNTTYQFTVKYNTDPDHNGASQDYTDTVQATTDPCSAPQPGRWSIPFRGPVNPMAHYGTQGVPDGANTPGSILRRNPAYTRDTAGNIWLFGGDDPLYVDSDHRQHPAGYADLWQWNGLSWVWVSGPNQSYATDDTTLSYPSVHGALGQADPSYHPGTMPGAHIWSDSSGSIWLYDAEGTGQIWTWDGTNWALINDCSVLCPGQRSNSPQLFPDFWSDPAGHLWVYSGLGTRNGSTSLLDDLWEWNGSTWTLLNGTGNGSLSLPVYGTQGVADPLNTPGGRTNAATGIDSSGNLWLFGGYVSNGKGSGGLDMRGDLWKWDGSAWTWVSGPDTPQSWPVYGAQGVADPANHPGARTQAVLWGDPSGNMWLFGGFGYDADSQDNVNPQEHHLNDLWKWDGSAWTWVDGSNIGDQKDLAFTNYGDDALFFPGGSGPYAWGDATGNLWMTGLFYNGYGSSTMNIWEYALPDSVVAGSGALQNGSFETSGGTASLAPAGGIQDVFWPLSPAALAPAAGSSSLPAGWVGKGLHPGAASSQDGLRTGDHTNGARSFTFAPGSGARSLYQDMLLSGPAGTDLTLTFNSTSSVPFTVTTILSYTNKTTGKFTMNVTNPVNSWAAYGRHITAANDFNKIEVMITGGKGSSASWFDNFKLIPSQPLTPNAELPPVLAAPRNGSLVYSHTLKLSWNAVRYATGYHVEVSPDNSFPQPAFQSGDPTGPAFTTQALAYGLYFWHVASKDTFGQGDYSAPFSFEVTLNKSPKNTVTLKSGLVKFVWAAVKGKGVTYDLQVNSAQDFTGTVFVDTTTGTPLKKPGYTMPKTGPLPGGLKTYYWRVRDSLTGLWTLPWSFTVK